MSGFSISRMALAIAISGIFLSHPIESFAAKNWLEKIFSASQPKPKHRKSKRAKSAMHSSSKSSGNKIRLPEVAPLPEAAVRIPAEVPAPEDKPVAGNEPVPDAVDEKNEPDSPAPSKPMDSIAAEPPKPDFRPDKPPPQAAQPEPPKPEFRPEKPDAEKTAEPPEPAPPPDPRSAEKPDSSGQFPEAEMSCRRRLAELGVKFKEATAESDPFGCSMPYPIVVDSLGSDIGLSPDAEMNCAMAETVAQFARDVISPTAKSIFGTSLKSISHASAYVCRSRNGTQKLSEHAFGNALDIAAFMLTDGKVVTVKPDPPEKDGQFLDRVREAACGPFKTVLGPGSNADHAEHLHFDLAPRRHGGTVCE